MNVDYNNRSAVAIKTNKQQSIDVTLREDFEDPTSGIRSELYLLSNADKATNSAPFEIYLVISYVPTADQIVEEFYTYGLNGTFNDKNLINENSESLVVSTEYSSLDKIELQWTKYYGLPENEINIRIVKDGFELNPAVYTRTSNNKKYNSIYLTHSGKYSISLYDVAGNVQTFSKGSAETQQFTLVFLKDVPFSVTYTDIETGEEVTSLPIKEAIYNGNVTIKLDNATKQEFYASSGPPVIEVKRNGVAYTGMFQDNLTYIFSESGYYEISFTATSKKYGELLRKETYQFTVLNANEHRYSYIVNKYSNYYIEKVVKDGEDITENLLKTIDLPTITKNNKPYFTNLPFSYIDQKTGVGTYLITINTNDQTLNNPPRFTFKIIIQQGKVPIVVSLAEGKSTTKAITVNYNQTNLYNEMGECTLQVVRYEDDKYISTFFSTTITAETTGMASPIEIDKEGTYYIQIVSPSGILLHSYKVIQKSPLNTASIISIIIAAVVLVAVIIIIIKLRKRISVK
ncbi:MAG: hypothetical protein E7375_00755 [Clostridiales bacterium]|nr:hypothetical protein [Clostridiales bacterium]